MSVHPPGEEVRRLAEKLIGTTGSDLVDAIDDLSTDQSRQLDMLAFECTSCNWWFAVTERREVKDKWVCTLCQKELLQ